jgi:hypothetical protein
VSGIFFLRKPPGMFGRNNSRVHAFKKFGALSDLTPGRFNNNPVTLGLCGAHAARRSVGFPYEKTRAAGGR